MPAVETLINDESTPAFQLPAGAMGFTLWNTNAATLRIGFSEQANAESLPLGNGTEAEPKYYVRMFDRPLKKPQWLHIYQSSGADISSGVGIDIITQ